MDDKTKIKMLERIEMIQNEGLTFRQNGDTKNSKNFTLTPLINALEAYAHGYNEWRDTHDWDAMKFAWINGVGEAQRDVVTHVANEYCRKDRGFSPTPQFNETHLPRELFFQNHDTDEARFWFPLENSSLGISFGIYRSPEVARGGLGWAAYMQDAIEIEIAAIRQLDLVRTNDLGNSLDFLTGNALSSLISKDSCS